MSYKTRVEAALAAKKSREAKQTAPPHIVPAPAGSVVPPARENPLIPLSRDLVSRMPLGAEAILASQAIKQWKASRALQERYRSVVDYFDVLVQLHGAGKLQIKEAFTMTEKIDGSEYGLMMHEKWVKAGRPGTFTAFLKAAQEEENKERQEQAKAGAGGGR